MSSTIHAAGGVRSVLTLSPQQIDRTPWTPVTACDGVSVKELWRRGDLVYALLRYEPGASTAGAPHPVDQHLWILEGEATIAERSLPAGSYIQVPAGTPHPIHATGTQGCVVLQSHTPAPSDAVGSVSAATCQQ
jgi:mannose-6-phosphate isomerase-like protein (cupin superfamily)